MSALHFEWDERKAVANLKKHGVSFEGAKSVFYDERAKLIDDSRTIPKTKIVSFCSV